VALPRTIVVGLESLGPQATYQLAPGLAQYVQSVYAEVDTSGSGDVEATLTIREQAGVVIAKKRQGETIDGSGAGSATWALRLDDNQTASGAIRYKVLNSGEWLDIETTGHGASGGEGMRIATTGSDPANNMEINSDVQLAVRAGTNLLLEASELVAMNVFTQGAAFILDTNNGPILLRMNDHVNTGAMLEISEGAVLIELSVGASVQVVDSAHAPIFEVRDDGSLHGKTGASLVFDL
jgi:hypothetical protein